MPIDSILEEVATLSEVSSEPEDQEFDDCLEIPVLLFKTLDLVRDPFAQSCSRDFRESDVLDL